MIGNYKKNDPRMWFFRNKYTKYVIWLFVVVVVISILYEKLIM